jgi:uncharacterized protein YlzI (FlbEa/FlbD family)
MHFIAVHKFQKDSSARPVFYLNPDYITMIETEGGASRVTLCSGREMLVSEIADDLITKIKGFTKPIRAPQPELATGEKLN